MIKLKEKYIDRFKIGNRYNYSHKQHKNTIYDNEASSFMYLPILIFHYRENSVFWQKCIYDVWYNNKRIKLLPLYYICG